ncbi:MULTISPECIES: hypothetical protein [Sphingobacterium]|uniref:hypothetical protein n=1 Tax=Sphingobacterium TaxID=28453 RepID=UPI0028AA2BBA|nr:hypothetical protein [Sphingobacterium multivorum]
MTTEGRYIFDNSTILAKCYELLSVLFGDKEFARRIDPNDPHCTLAALKSRYFESSITRLMIEIAATVRVMQDQINLLPAESEERQIYEQRIQIVDEYDFDEFDPEDYKLRKVCNKIIHANSIKLMAKEGAEAHANDFAFLAGDTDKNINWKYHYGLARLAGKDIGKKKDWSMLLDIEVFATAVFDLLDWNRSLE